jgi:Predicted metal-dependent hydrolase of the TIM-barrel fold
MFSDPQLRYIPDTLGTDRILYSVDYPYIEMDKAAGFLENAQISDEDKEKIAHGNAEKLLTR